MKLPRRQYHELRSPTAPSAATAEAGVVDSHKAKGVQEALPMCGRFTLRASAAVIAREFGLPEVPDLTPRFNIAPGSQVAVVRRKSESDARELVLLHWGLIPSWAAYPSIGKRMANTRSETVATKPAFRRSFRLRRCLLVADGFYEWQPTDGGKQPYFASFQGDRPFGLAGLWDHWDKRGQPIESCTIITTDANELMRPIHERMPVIIAPDRYGIWLDARCQDSEELKKLMRPCASNDMLAYPVSTRVNDPKNDTAECVKAIG